MQRRSRGASCARRDSTCARRARRRARGNGNGNGPKATWSTLATSRSRSRGSKTCPPRCPTASAAAVADAAAAAESPPIGTIKFWPPIDFPTGGVGFELFTLRGVGDKIEIWVANYLDFPAGDCRNDGVRNVITAAQLIYFTGQFDGNIDPKIPPPSARRPAATAPVALLEQAGLPPGYYAGPGGKIVTLIANFRDENFTDITFPSYVAGYHSSDINTFVNRNVMSIDSYDWVHRTGANPPNEPSTCSAEPPGAAVQVRGRLRARVPAPARVLGEPRRAELGRRGSRRLRDHRHGLRLPGPLDLRDRLRRPHPDVPRLAGCCRRRRTRSRSRRAAPRTRSRSGTTRAGSRRSPTTAPSGRSWSSSPAGTAPAFMTDLHNEDANGIKGLQAVLDNYLTGDKAHGRRPRLGRDGRARQGDRRRRAAARLPAEARYQTPSLSSSIYWENPQSYSTPGAPPNGSDYVQLRDAAGKPLLVEGHPLDRVLEPGEARPGAMEWQSVPSAATRSSPPVPSTTPTARSSAPSLFPASGDRTLTFDTATARDRAGTSPSCRSRPTTA